MNLLLFSAYYEPEVAASLYLSTNLYEDIASSGINVKLYVPTPTRGVTDDVRKAYKGKVERHFNGKLEIIRLNIPKESSRTILRLLRYIWMHVVFLFSSRSVDTDAIFVQSTPPTQGAMASLIKKRKNIPFIYNLQDIFPDSLVATGITKSDSFIYRVGRKLENYTYRNADCIVVISNDMKDNILKKGVPEEKVYVIPNWIDVKEVYPIPRNENYLFDKYGIDPSKFIVVYAGNLGYAQNIEMIIKAAKELRDNNQIQFVVFGKGSQENEYKRLAKDLSNISFFPIQPYSEVSYVYSLGDASIVPCKRGFGGSAMPSKTWSIMATGTPVLASFDKGTDLEAMLNTTQSGLFSESDDVESFVDNIIRLFNDPSLVKEMGSNARMYVEHNLSRKVCTQMYISLIEDIVEERK